MRVLLKSLMILAAAATPALAQQPPPAGQVPPSDQAPPARVGRISLAQGPLAFYMTGETSWSAAALNYPVPTGATFWTAPGSRAEIRIGAETIDMDASTELTMEHLDDQVTQIGLSQGRIGLDLYQLGQGQSVEIDIPQGGIWLLGPGRYDIEADGPGKPARIAVFAGSARFVGGGTNIGIAAGKAALVSGAAPITASVRAIETDAFMTWCQTRDQIAARSAPPRYVSTGMTGYADLATYGSWQSVSQYGEVWYPRSVPAGWAPYHDGHWLWVEPWGWTWVDTQPWGFAPFHYGRWARIDDRWGWIPGEIVPQPVYAPALVAFLGGALVAGHAPSIGWFPLAPGEPYYPSYTRNPAYFRTVNRADVRDIQHYKFAAYVADPAAQIARTHFVNRGYATVVPRQVFAEARPVAPAALHVAPAQLEHAAIVARPEGVRSGPAGFEGARPGLARPGVAPGAVHGPEAGGGRTLPSNAAALPPVRGPAAHEAPHAAAPMHEAPHAAAPMHEAPHAAAPMHEAPHAAAPMHEAPHAAAPMHEAPHAAAPMHEVPHAAAPMHEAPHAAAPMHEAPRAAAPMHEAPHAAAPMHEAPRAAAPMHEAPHAAAPMHEAPHAAAPMHEAPRAAAPMYEAPRAAAPMREAPHAAAPMHEAPRAAAPMHAAPRPAAPMHEAPRAAPAREAPRAAPHPAPHPEGGRGGGHEDHPG